MTTLGGPAQATQTTQTTLSTQATQSTQSTQAMQSTQLADDRRKRNAKKKKLGPKQPKKLTIDGQDLIIVKTLGQGAYGLVEKVEDKEGHSYAIKRVEFHADKGVYADIIKEMDILRRFSSHPNIIGLCGYAWRDKEFIVLMEYGGTPLHRYIGNVEYAERMELLPMIMWANHECFGVHAFARHLSSRHQARQHAGGGIRGKGWFYSAVCENL